MSTAQDSVSLNASNTPFVTTSALLNMSYGTGELLVNHVRHTGNLVDSAIECLFSSSGQVYEYAITFNDEITFLRDSKWSIVKIIYLVCRYLMFPFVITNTFHLLQRGLTLEECESYSQFNFFAGVTIIFCADHKGIPSPLTPSANCQSAVMFLVRTHALWHRSRAALIIIIMNFAAFIIPMLVILALFDSAYVITPVSGITSCNDVPQSLVIVWSYVVLVIGETGNHAWDSGHSDAPFPVEFRPKEERIIKSRAE
ncbi:hypothetical protein BDN67DRAFT_1015571 [Paxillus ammoniavirescens]|nr:hypothetical protein BDN67DRAFT_1015571 [Paxillus ammoniavirescens]